MPLVSFVVTCMGRLAHVKECLHTLLAQRRSEVVFVDFSCPEKSGEWVRENYPAARVIEVKGHTTFNKCVALNAGIRAARGSWITAVDADCKLKEGFVESIVESMKDNEFAVVEQREPGSTGFLTFRRNAKVKYDETLGALGYGEEDHDMLMQLSTSGYRGVACAADWVSMIQHGDDLRTKHRAVATLGGNLSKTCAYMAEKWKHLTKCVTRDSEGRVRFDFNGLSKTCGKKRSLLFILPGLHGDTIINMPAAKWWADRGWDVTWATQDTWTYRAFFEHFPYVTPFFAKHGGGKFFDEVDHLAKGFDKVIDLYRVGFKSPHEEPRERDNHLVHFRYKLAGVDSEERWKLSWKRFPAREDALFKKVVGKLDRYTLVHDETWCGSLKLGKPNHPVVRFRQIKPYSIFDWYKVILHASEILAIDSSLANFVEVLPAALQIPKTVATRKEAMWSSIYRSNWRIAHGNLPESPVVSFGLNDTKLDVPSKLIETEPPRRRGEGKLLVVSKGAVSVADIADLPKLLHGRAVYANNSKVRRGKFWLYRDTGHRFGATLLRRTVDGRWLAHVEAPPALVMDGRYTTSDRNRVEIREEWKLPNTYLLAFEREPEFEKFANLYTYPGKDGTSRPGSLSRHESVYATVDGSVVPDSSGLRLDAKIVKLLKLRYVTYHADMSQAESRGGGPVEPEFYSVDESPNGDAVCVGQLAARAVESFAATGKTSGMTTLRLEREPKWRKITGLLLPLPLPTEPDGDVLLAALGRKLFVQLMKRGVREKMRFGRFGDLALVL